MENQVIGGAEVRRIHVIYFLSRKGHIEHPHLIRVHHLSRNGVHLRDVKRWLSELRGKEMPDSFAWSYKRRYKKGYVWQDLVDEDLITPISDNEYVLKGSEISFSTTTRKEEEESEKQSQNQTIKEEKSQEKEKEEGIIQETKLENKKSRKTEYPEMDTESISCFGSDKSTTLTDDSSSSFSFSFSSSSFTTKLEQDNNINHSRDHRFKVKMLHQEDKEHDHRNKTETDHSIPPTFTVSSKGNNQNNTAVVEEVVEKGNKPPDSNAVSSSSSSSSTFNRSKSYSNGASMLFRNLISCGTAETNDSALVTINKHKKSSQTSSLSKPIIHDIGVGVGAGTGTGTDLIMTKDDNQSNNVFETSLNRHPPYAPSRRSFDGVRTPSKSKKTEFNNQKEIPPFKPIKGPLCSQCEKPFKPEKMHAHMKSCKATKKAMRSKCNRSAIPSDSATFDDKKGSEEISSEFTFDSDPPSGYYLMPGR